MEYDDYKIDPDAYQQMANAYFSTLAENNFKFVKINTDKNKKQEILDTTSNYVGELNWYIEYLNKTIKSKKNKKFLQQINNNFQSCKNLFNCYSPSQIPLKNNFCNSLKKIIELCCDIILQCNLFSNFSQSNIDDKILDSIPHFIEIIKNTTQLFGECHYRY